MNGVLININIFNKQYIIKKKKNLVKYINIYIMQPSISKMANIFTLKLLPVV